MQPKHAWLAATILGLVLLPGQAFAAASAAAPGVAWGIPFAGTLLSIALLPMLAPRFWHRRMGLVAAFWILALVLPEAVANGVGATAAHVWHAILLEYLPFVTLLLALFTAGGGILLQGGPWGRPAGNTLLLAVGTLLAGVMGTTGVSMVLIHPLLRANAHRTRKVHLVVFFILLVSNAGGATTPLGDPPLYIGFLHGVPFFWPLVHVGPPLVVLALPLLAAFWLLDRHLARGEPPPGPPEKLRLRGWVNVALIGVVVADVLVQGVWRPGPVALFGEAIGAERLAGMALFLVVVAVSVAATPRAVRQGNLFSWEPMEEVGVLFAAIFITIAPVLAMLAAGFDGPLAVLLHATRDAQDQPIPLAIFWMSGLLSALLDNAPTYLVFFEMSGNDAVKLTTELATALQALSAGAVFFGALTYIGNAPNLMVRSIAAHRGVRMPSFFGYTAWAAGLMLLPLLLVSVLFFL